MASILDLIDGGNQATAEAPEPAPTASDAFSQGLRSSAISERGKLNKVAGTAMDAVGLDGSGRTAAAAADQDEAARTSAGMPGISDVHDVSSGLRYAAGTAGSLIPSAVPAIGAAMMTKGGAIPEMLAGSAATLPSALGGQLQRQDADPANANATPQDRLRAALPAAAGSALVQNIVPAGVASRLAGRAGEASIAQVGLRAAADIPTNAAAAAGSEAISQYGDNALNPNAGYDPNKIVDAAKEGAGAGALFGAAGAVGHAAGSLVGKAAGAPGAAIDAIKALAPDKPVAEPVEAPGASETAQSTPDLTTSLGKLWDQGKASGAALMEKMANGKEAADPQMMAANPEKAQADADQTTFEAAQAWGSKMLNQALPPEKRTQLVQAMSDLGDKANQQTVAMLAKGQQAFETTKQAVGDFADSFAKPDVPAGTKQSADYSDVRAKIGEALSNVPGLADHPAMQDDATRNNLADGLRQYIEQISDGRPLDVDTLNKLTNILGDQTTPTLKAVHDAVGDPDADKASFFNTLNQIDAVQKGKQGVLDVMQKNLVPALQDAVRPSELKLEADMLSKWAESKATTLKGKEELDHTDAQVKNALATRYGDKADVVLAAVEKNLKKEQSILDTADLTEKTLDEGQSSVKYYGQNKQLYLNPDLDKGGVSKAGVKYDGAATQAMRRAERDNPGASVQFRKASEIGLEDKMVKAKHADLVDRAQADGMTPEEAEAHADKHIDNFGAVTAESSKQETKLNSGEVDNMRLDTKAFGKSPARIDTVGLDGKPMAVDAIKLVKGMAEKMKGMETKSNDTSGLARTTNLFKEGIAALTDHLGHKIDVPDSTQITPGKNGVTWGEAKKLDGRTDADKANDTRTQKITQLRAEFKAADTLKEKAKIASEGKKLVGDQEWDRIKDMSAKESQVEDEGGREPEKSDNVHVALKGGENDKAVIRTNLDGSARGDTVMGRRKAAGPIDGPGPDVPYTESQRQTKGIQGEKPGPVNTAADLRLAKKLDDSANARRAATREEPPSPKALAAKQAAFVEKARSGDKAQLDTLTKSTDPKGLQRAVEHLNSLKDLKNPGIVKTVDTINDRMSELVQQPGVGYAMQTKGYRFEAANEPAGDLKARVGAAIDGLSDKDLQTLHNDELARDPDASKMPSALKEAFKDWLHEYDPSEREEMMAMGQEHETYAKFYDEVTPEHGKLEYALAQAKLTGAKLGEVTKFDQTRADPNAMGTADRKAVEDHIEKVLGPAVAVHWAAIMHAGEFVKSKANEMIRLSVHSLDPMSTAFHESMHGFFAHLKEDGQSKYSDVLEKAASSAPVMNRLRELLKNEPEALKQLSDPEERAAYMYQFHQQGKLSLGEAPTTLFGRIGQFLRKLTGMWSNDEHAEKIMNYFHSGEYEKNRGDPNAVASALGDSTLAKTLVKVKNMTEPFREMGESVASAGGAALRDTGIGALRDLADAMKLKTTTEGKDPGYLPAARSEKSQRMNKFMADLHPYSAEHVQEALEAMQNGTKAGSVAARHVQVMTQKHLADSLKYMQDAGVKISALGIKDGVPYFPRNWDASYVSSHQRQFLTMLDKYVQNGALKGAPRDVLNKLMVTDGAEFHINNGGLNKPGMQNAKERTLAFIDHADAAPFMRKNLYETMNSYMTQATRRAEWARRFSDDGSGLTTLLDKAKAQGANQHQMEQAQKFVQAVDGTLGDNINPTARRLMGNMIVYQNLRLLPLAIFSSAVDPLGIMVRGGTVGDAFKTFKRGLGDMAKNFQKDPKSDKMTQLSEAIGTIDNAMMVHTLGASYSQGMVGNAGRKINDTFFRLNLMEQFNSSMRVGATEAAMGFIKQHATSPSEHSVRFLRELGLDAKDVQVGGDGRIKVLESDGLSLEHSAQMKAAVNRFVDGAVLRPDAVDKPIWMSDPHYALLAHLKQFVFSFHETILKRVAHEAKNGNYSPAMALASYVPVMIAADAAKGLIQGGGQQPDWKQDWGPGDYAWSGAERAGLFGTGQFALDALGDIKEGGNGIGALEGPSIEQLTDALKVMGGREQFHNFAVKSMPANALYAGALHADATDPQFSD